MGWLVLHIRLMYPTHTWNFKSPFFPTKTRNWCQVSPSIKYQWQKQQQLWMAIIRKMTSSFGWFGEEISNDSIICYVLHRYLLHSISYCSKKHYNNNIHVICEFNSSIGDKNIWRYGMRNAVRFSFEISLCFLHRSRGCKWLFKKIIFQISIPSFYKASILQRYTISKE